MPLAHFLGSGYYSGAAKQLVKDGDYQESLRFFDEAIRRKPNDPDIYYNRGVAYFNLGQVDKALTDWAKTLDLDDTFYQAHFNIGLVMFHNGSFDLALSFMENAERLGFTQAREYIRAIRQNI